LLETHASLRAPHLLDAEVTQVIRRSAIADEIDEQRGRQALSDRADFPIRRHAHDFLLSRVWELRNNLTAYDAVYVALSAALDAPLLTRDAPLSTAAGHHAHIELVAP